jgi:hypothetical protein
VRTPEARGYLRPVAGYLFDQREELVRRLTEDVKAIKTGCSKRCSIRWRLAKRGGGLGSL